MNTLHIFTLGVMMIITMNVILVNAYAQNSSSYQNGSTNTSSDTDDAIPNSLSQSDLEKVKQIALSDPTVKKILEGKSYKLVAQGFVGNVYHKPVTWYPELYFNIDNKTQLTVVVSLANDSVTYSKTSETMRLGGPIHIQHQDTNNTTFVIHNVPPVNSFPNIPIIHLEILVVAVVIGSGFLIFRRLKEK